MTQQQCGEWHKEWVQSRSLLLHRIASIKADQPRSAATASEQALQAWVACTSMPHLPHATLRTQGRKPPAASTWPASAALYCKQYECTGTPCRLQPDNGSAILQAEHAAALLGTLVQVTWQNWFQQYVFMRSSKAAAAATLCLKA
jgi:hypothetical protein